MPTTPDESRLTPRGASRLLQALLSDRGEADGGRESPGADDVPADARSLPPGFSVERELGRGGGGVVFLARKEGSDRRLALKLIRSPSPLAWHELEAVEQVIIPCLPRLIDWGTAPDGRLYVATEYVEGLHLDAWCDARLLSTRDRVSLLTRVARAVHTLHQHGVIHRDLKPSNILINAHGDPVLIDLGLASLGDRHADAGRHAGEDGPASQPRITSLYVGGTPAYMAPEQARGQRPTTQTDCYALGTVALRVLAPGADPDALGAVTDPTDLPAFASGARRARRRALAAIIRKARAHDPAARYASAADLADDLDRWVRGEHVLAVRPGPLARLCRSVARHPILATTAASLVIALAIVGGAAGGIWWVQRAPSHLQLTPDHTTLTLYSRAGSILRTWHVGAVVGADDVRDVPYDFLPATRSPTGRPLVVAAMPYSPDDVPEEADQVAVWDATRPQRPIWYTRSVMPGLRAPRTRLPEITGRDLRARTPEEERYVANRLLLADFFPDLPGDELAVVHTMDIDPACIRIYDLRTGEVLFQAWHWGSISRMLWLPRSRLLVFLACDNRDRWERFLPGPSPPRRWPAAVAALRISRTFIGWVNPAMAEPGEEALWYRWLEPLEAYHQAAPTSLTLAPSVPEGERFSITITSILHPDASLDLVANAEGRSIRCTPNDVYNNAVAAGLIEPLPEFYLAPPRTPAPN